MKVYDDAGNFTEIRDDNAREYIEQINELIGNLESLGFDADTIVDAINKAYNHGGANIDISDWEAVCAQIEETINNKIDSLDPITVELDENGDIHITGKTIKDGFNEEDIREIVESYNYISEIPDTPEKLPSPYALNINGTVYDGSEEKIVNIPTNGNTMKMNGNLTVDGVTVYDADKTLDYALNNAYNILLNKIKAIPTGGGESSELSSAFSVVDGKICITYEEV